MPWGYAAAAIGSAAIGAISADKAADAQSKSSAAAIAEQRRQHDLAMERSQPFYEGSLNAYNSLLEMEGLGGVGGGGQQKQQAPSILDNYTAAPGVNRGEPGTNFDIRNDIRPNYNPRGSSYGARQFTGGGGAGGPNPLLNNVSLLEVSPYVRMA